MGAMMNEDRFGVCQLAIDVASVGAATTVEQTFTLKGLKLNDFVVAMKPSLNAGLAVAGARVSAPDTVAIKFLNTTGAPIDPPLETYLVFWFRPEKLRSAVNI